MIDAIDRCLRPRNDVEAELPGIGANDEMASSAITVNTPPRQVSETLVPESTDDGGELVLVVEDNRTNRLFATQVLEDCGYTVKEAVNGQEAVEAVRSNEFKAILMDCQMPVMDGYQATAKISSMMQQGEVSAAPIIALTANAMPGDRERCFSAGMHEYLTKPCRKADLVATLKKWSNASPDSVVPATRPEHDIPPATNDLCKNESSQASVPSQPQKKNNASVAEDPGPLSTEIASNHSELMPNIEEDEVSILDLGALEKVRIAMKGDFSSILSFFIEDSAAYIETIAQGLATKSPDSARLAAHSLKSSASQLGAMRLSGLARQLEADIGAMAGQDLDQRQLDKLEALVPLLRETFETTKTAFEELG